MTPDGRLRVIVVCLGNICRSPIGEAVLRDRVRTAGLGDRVDVESAGTGGWHVGDPADPRGQAALARAGYVLQHRARRFDPDWYDDADLVLAMDSENRAALLRMAPDTDAARRVRMMRAFDPRLAGRSDDDPLLDVPDPYYGGPDGFDAVVGMLEAAADGVVTHLATLTDQWGDPGAEARRGARPAGPG
jgi:protein-tyrosine phosphatase